MLTRMKKYFAIQRYYDFGEMIGEVLCGKQRVDIHRYFLIKTEYMKARDRLAELNTQPYQVDTWTKIIGWERKYPKISILDSIKFKEICDADESDFKSYEKVFER